MKKYFSILTAILLACSSSIALASCGSDDDDDPIPPANAKPVSAELTTCAWFSKDIVDYVNIDVTYVDANGATQKAEVGKTAETMSVIGDTYTVYPVKATASFTRFPAKLEMKIRYTRKPNVTVQPDQVLKFTFISQKSAKVIYDNGEKVDFNNPTQQEKSLTFKGEKLDYVINSLNESCDDVEVEVENDGEIDF